MAVIEVPMISGFRADVESLERVKKKSHHTTNNIIPRRFRINPCPKHSQTHRHPVDNVVSGGSEIALQSGKWLNEKAGRED